MRRSWVKGGGDEEEVAALRTALKTSEGKLIEAAEHAENVKWLRAALQKAEKAAAAADEKVIWKLAADNNVATCSRRNHMAAQ